MKEEKTTPLRQRMIEDMDIRGLAEKTQKAHIRNVKLFAAFLGRSPDAATPDDLRAWQLHMVKAGTSASTFNVRIISLRFFSGVTCGREEMKRYMQFHRQGKGTVGAYVGRARKAGLTWPLPDALSDDDLELLLFPAPPAAPDGDRPVPDWAVVDRELRRPGVTRALLWEEYRAAHPLGFGYAWFCEHYEARKGRVRPVAPEVRLWRNAADACRRGEGLRRLRRRHDRRDRSRDRGGPGGEAVRRGVTPKACLRHVMPAGMPLA